VLCISSADVINSILDKTYQYCYLLLAAGSSIGLKNTWRCMCSFELLMMELARLAAGSSIGLTNTWRYMCSFELVTLELARLAAGSSIGLTNIW